MLVVALARLHVGPHEQLPPWAVLLSSAGFTALSLFLLRLLILQPGPRSVSDIWMTVSSVAGTVLFGVGGVAYAILTVQRWKDTRRR